MLVHAELGVSQDPSIGPMNGRALLCIASAGYECLQRAVARLHRVR
jgi:hypothetical protein